MNKTPIEKAISEEGSARRLAESLNVTVMAVSLWRNGHRRISTHIAKKLNKKYGIPLSEIRPDIWEEQS